MKNNYLLRKLKFLYLNQKIRKFIFKIFKSMYLILKRDSYKGYGLPN